jgi:hypothetical protein
MEDKRRVVETLIGRLGDSDSDVRKNAILVLHSFLALDVPIEDKRPVVDLLIARLGDSKSYVRCAACEALGPFLASDAPIEDKRPVVAALIIMLQDSSSSTVRKVASEALDLFLKSDAPMEDKKLVTNALTAKRLREAATDEPCQHSSQAGQGGSADTCLDMRDRPQAPAGHVRKRKPIEVVTPSPSKPVPALQLVSAAAVPSSIGGGGGSKDALNNVKRVRYSF